MESATQKKKSVGLSKGKLKKTIKNVLCRPDPIVWPVISEDSEKSLRVALSNFKVEIPPFTKPHWKELKRIPKEERPKPPKLQKPDGFIFGVQECVEAVKNKNCSALLIESEVNPRLILQPVIEACTTHSIPIVCIKHLRKLSAINFGIRTICLGVKKDCLEELSNKISQIAGNVKPKHNFREMDKSAIIDEINEIEISHEITNTTKAEIMNHLLYRKGKKSRIFIPNSENDKKDSKQTFIGQHFIPFSEEINKLNQDKGSFKNMMLKRITNNPNRVKEGKKRKH